MRTRAKWLAATAATACVLGGAGLALSHAGATTGGSVTSSAPVGGYTVTSLSDRVTYASAYLGNNDGGTKYTNADANSSTLGTPEGFAVFAYGHGNALVASTQVSGSTYDVVWEAGTYTGTLTTPTQVHATAADTGTLLTGVPINDTVQVYVSHDDGSGKGPLGRNASQFKDDWQVGAVIISNFGATTGPKTGTSFTTYVGNSCTLSNPDAYVSHYGAGSAAEWTSTGAVLTPGSSSGTYADVNMLRVLGKAVPTTPPTFTTTNYNSGSPRWVIELSNGNYVVGYADHSNGNGTYTVSAGSWVADIGGAYGPTDTTYANAVSEAEAGGSNVTVKQAFINADGDQTAGTKDTLTDIQYNGVTYTGHGCGNFHQVSVPLNFDAAGYGGEANNPTTGGKYIGTAAHGRFELNDVGAAYTWTNAQTMPGNVASIAEVTGSESVTPSSVSNDAFNLFQG